MSKKKSLPFIPKTRPYLMIPADCGFCVNSHFAAEDLGGDYRGVIYCDYLKQHILGSQFCSGFCACSDFLCNEYIVEVDADMMSDIHPFDLSDDLEWVNNEE